MLVKFWVWHGALMLMLMLKEGRKEGRKEEILTKFCHGRYKMRFIVIVVVASVGCG